MKSEVPPLRLVVWITVDQMRGDYLERYGERFGEDGFQKIVSNSVWYQDAHLGHAITETAPGHATFFTGVAPSTHGIIGNAWLTPEGEIVTSVLDSSHKLLSAAPSSGGKAGRSPHRLLSPTIGDELRAQTQNQALVYSVSVKDRGAILPAGHKGEAYWFSGGAFVTSTFYKSEAPSWLREHHKTHPPESYIEEGWPLLLGEEKYKNAPAQSPHATRLFGEGFPHKLPAELPLGETLAHSPMGDVAVLDLARTLLLKTEIGSDEVPDLLSISLSATDYVGHFYGPESREMEDQLLRLDRLLSGFLQFLDKKVGSESYRLVLSADHGALETSHFLRKSGVTSHRVSGEELSQAARKALVRRYGHDKFFEAFRSPYIHLKGSVASSEEVPLSEVESVVCAALDAVSGVYGAFARSQILEGAGVPEEVLPRLQAAVHPERSGEIYVVPARNSVLLQRPTLAASHGSPWEYDAHVPPSSKLTEWGGEGGKDARRREERGTHRGSMDGDRRASESGLPRSP